MDGLLGAASTRRALRQLGFEPDNATVEPLVHNPWLTAGIARVVDGGDGDRSVIVKRLARSRPTGASAWDRHWAAGADDERHWSYWAREAKAFESGLTELWARSGIRAPRCHLIVDAADSIDLYLEDVHGLPGEQWPLEAYGEVARALGRAQGGVVVAERAADRPWLSRHFLRDYVTDKPVDYGLLDDDAAWRRPLVAEHFPAELRPAAGFLHAHRDELLAIAEALPRTLCHLDFWPKNLIRTDDGYVAIDWSFTGDGALGEDIGNLVPDSSFDHFVPAAELPALEAIAVDGYLAGLREAGGPFDADLVRLGVWASSVKYDWLTPAMLDAATQPVQRAYGGQTEIDAAFRFRERGQALLFTAGWAERAIDLARTAGFLPIA